MREFQVLPTDSRFTDLTDYQIGFIMENMGIDAKQKQLAMKGIDPASYMEDDDSSWWSTAHDKFEALREDHDEEEISRQVEALSNKKQLEEVRARYKSTAEWNKFLENGGAAAKKLETEEIMKTQLEKVYKEAQELNSAGISKWGEIQKIEEEASEKLGTLTEGTIKGAVDLFNGDFADVPLPSLEDDDDFMI